MSKGEGDYSYSENIICFKWYENKSVLLLAANVDGMSGVPNIMRRTKASATQAPVSSPSIIKLYNNDMNGVDIVDQKTAAYRIDRKSKYRFYLRIFFDLMDVALVNSHIVYTKLDNDILLLNFNIVVTKSLICRYSNCKRFLPTSRKSKQKFFPRDFLPLIPREVPNHMPEVQDK